MKKVIFQQNFLNKNKIKLCCKISDILHQMLYKKLKVLFLLSIFTSIFCACNDLPKKTFSNDYWILSEFENDITNSINDDYLYISFRPSHCQVSYMFKIYKNKYTPFIMIKVFDNTRKQIILDDNKVIEEVPETYQCTYAKIDTIFYKKLKKCLKKNIHKKSFQVPKNHIRMYDGDVINIKIYSQQEEKSNRLEAKFDKELIYYIKELSNMFIKQKTRTINIDSTLKRHLLSFSIE
ncbi:MAG: hypothetical protein EAZ06_03405 [Cytophagales bacterium]|nr:MAG: hypothetical protein EAZ06_03405 [Cytophagales bacterium]